ncbi:MAG: hypothetical protein J6X18_09625 [Bacteroidales bacterium]|nr:hypothetical protein [Bacteroidales bacterium]
MQNKPKHKKINLEFVGEDFSFDKEHGKTKCVITFNPHFKDFAELYGHPSDDVLAQSPKRFAALIDVFKKDFFKTSGVSICSEKDKYDFEFGMEVARQRARARAERKYNHWLVLYYDVLEKCQQRLEKAYRQSLTAMEVNEYLETVYRDAI